MKILDRLLAAGLLLGLAACTDPRHHARATAVLVDVSGTYTDKLPEVVRIVRAGLLPGLHPGDTLVVIRVGEQSYQEQALVEGTPLTLDAQPSRANQQKLELARKLAAFGSAARPARFTDISGALLLAAEHLRATQAGRRAIVIFSDMKEELPRGVRRTLAKDELAGTAVLAMNVKRLAADSADPAAYRARLDGWGQRLVEAGAASWKVVLEPEELAREFEGE